MTYKVKFPVVQVDILTPSSKLMRQKERLDAYKFHSDLYMYVSVQELPLPNIKK